jgi:hypothetical protein
MCTNTRLQRLRITLADLEAIMIGNMTLAQSLLTFPNWVRVGDSRHLLLVGWHWVYSNAWRGTYSRREGQAPRPVYAHGTGKECGGVATQAE